MGSLRERIKVILDKLPELKGRRGTHRSDPFSDQELDECVGYAAVEAFKNTAINEGLNVPHSDQELDNKLKAAAKNSEAMSQLKVHFGSLRRREQKFRTEKELIEEIELKSLRRRFRYRVYTAGSIAAVILMTSFIADLAEIQLPFMRMASPAAALVP